MVVGSTSGLEVLGSTSCFEVVGSVSGSDVVDSNFSCSEVVCSTIGSEVVDSPSDFEVVGKFEVTSNLELVLSKISFLKVVGSTIYSLFVWVVSTFEVVVLVVSLLS